MINARQDHEGQFRIVAKGYDRGAVGRRLVELDTELAEARRRAEVANAVLASVRSQLFKLRAQGHRSPGTTISSPEPVEDARQLADRLTHEAHLCADALLAAATTKAAKITAAADQRAASILDAATERTELVRAGGAGRRSAASDAATALRARAAEGAAAVLTEAADRARHVWERALLDMADIQRELERLEELRTELRARLEQAAGQLYAAWDALGGQPSADVSPSVEERAEERARAAAVVEEVASRRRQWLLQAQID